MNILLLIQDTTQKLSETESTLFTTEFIQWSVTTLIAIGGLILAYFSYKKKSSKSLTSVGSTMVRYWDKREDAQKDIIEKLKKAKDDIFIAGIGLTTMSKALLDTDTIKHIAELIDNENSNFKIRIIGCDNVNNAKRTFIPTDKVEERIKNGKGFLNEFLEKLKNEVKGKNSNNIEKFVEINNYPENITPRHSIIEIDDVIYVGSYMHGRLGKESYTMKLVDEESQNQNNKRSGLYNLFQSEITLLKENCMTSYKLN